MAMIESNEVSAETLVEYQKLRAREQTLFYLLVKTAVLKE